MQDQIFGRLWEAHHEQFSADASKAIGAASAKARNLLGGVPMPLKAMAAVLAMSVTSLVFATPSLAQDQVSVRAVSRAVSYADLNVASAEGRAALEQRVRGAANLLCQPNIAGVTGERVLRHRCYVAAVASARPQIDAAVAQRLEERLAAARTITITAR